MKWFFKPDPKELMDQQQGFSIHEVRNALDDVSVRRRWLLSITEELANLHKDLDTLLLKDASPDEIRNLAIRRRTISWILEQAMNAKTSKEMALRHNPDEVLVA